MAAHFPSPPAPLAARAAAVWARLAEAEPPLLAGPGGTLLPPPPNPLAGLLEEARAAAAAAAATSGAAAAEEAAASPQPMAVDGPPASQAAQLQQAEGQPRATAAASPAAAAPGQDVDAYAEVLSSLFHLQTAAQTDLEARRGGAVCALAGLLAGLLRWALAS